MSENVRSSTPHSVWLCPTHQSAQRLSNAISDYSTRTGEAAFAPHATLLGDLGGPSAKTAQACRVVAADLAPISARVTALSTTQSFFMALFLDIALPQKMTQARARLPEILGVPNSGTFRPHVSLGYGPEAAKISAQDAEALEKLFVGEIIIFDRIAVVASAKSIPIDEWCEVYSIPL